MKSTTASTAILFSLLASVAGAQNPASPSAAERRFQILAGGGFNQASRSFSEVTTFTAFLEEGTSTRSYDGASGPLFEVGAIYSITPSIGVLGSFELFSGNNDGAFEEIVPHPLLFNQDRSVSGELTDLSYDERALHLDIVYSIHRGSVSVDLFGGPTFFFTETELVTEVTTRSVYPFDDLELGGSQSSTFKENPIGFNAGGAFTYRFTPVFGVYFQGRFSRASVSVERVTGEPAEFDAGGFRAGAGIRLAF